MNKPIRILIGALLIITIAVFVHRSLRNAPEELAVANSFGRFQGFLLSSNYPAAYETMSSDFKAAHSLQAFKGMDENRAVTWMNTKFDWNFGARVNVEGDNAELRLKYNSRYGTVLRFVKEDGVWRFTNKTFGFE